MKKIFYTMAALALLGACAKSVVESDPQKAKRSFDSWAQVRCPNAHNEANQPVNWNDGSVNDYFGVYLDPSYEVEGNGMSVLDSNYVYVRFTVRTALGYITGSSEKDTMQKVGRYKAQNYIGPVVWKKSSDAGILGGVRNGLNGMKEGGKRRIFIPPWLMTTTYRATNQEYFNAGSTGVITHQYEMEVLDAISSIDRWCIDSMVRYVAAHPTYPYRKSDDDVPAELARFVRARPESADTTALGWWYQRRVQPSQLKRLPNDTTIYIRFVGRLNNGKVFDTNVLDTARKYGLYSSSSTYSPMQIKMAEKHYDIKFISPSDGSENSLITGFTYTLRNMHPGEGGVALVHQGMGYASTVTEQIPAYTPLVFELQLVPKPE